MSDEDKRTIEVENGAFELKIHWNKGVMSLQAALLLGAGALYICTNNAAVRHLVLLVVIIDVICILFYLLSSSGKKEEEKTEQTTETKEETPSTMDTDVKHEKATKSSVSKSDKQIKNKVPIPNPNAQRTHASATVPTTPTVEPEVKAEEKQAVQPQVTLKQEDIAKDAQMSDMDTSDWDDFFPSSDV